MVDIVYSSRFIKSAGKLPSSQARKLATLLEYLSKDPYHSLLHTKHLSSPLLGYLSFRISREWRVIFRFTDTAVIELIDTAHRKDIYR